MLHPDIMSRKSALFALHGVGLLVVVVLIGFRILASPSVMEPDSGRYISMGLNLAEYGTLSNHTYRPDTVPPPSMAEGGPLTAFEIGLAVRLHAPTRETLMCMAARGFPGTSCTGSLLGLKLLYAIELAVFLFALYRVALLVFAQDTIRAWIAVLAALACKEAWQYSRHILSEPLFLAMAGLFLWAWLAAWQRPQRATGWLLAGLLLGLTVLVKPSWLALGPVVLGLMLVFAWHRLSPYKLLLAVMAFGLGLAVPTGLLLLRNYIQLGEWTMSDPHYLIGSLSHRAGFNLMTWRVWLMGWIYYLPGFGDDLGAWLFGRDAVWRLGWDAGGYYDDARAILHVQMRALSTADAQQHLLNEYYLSDPLKNIAVTALLAMRGLFVGGKWGLFGLMAIIPLLLWLLPRGEQRRLWWLLLLPALAMVGINAQLSVSIVRYNLALIPAFAIALSAAVYALGVFAAKAIRRDRM